ncbi:hypothetical protein ACS0TY_009802 [Phlomoides rotata]
MATNDMAVVASDISDPDMQKFLHEGLPYDSENDGDVQKALKVSSEVGMALAYTSEKLGNLENLLSHVLAGEHDIEPTGFEEDNISAEFIEKAFTFDLLYAILNFELRELENLLADLQDLTVDALNKISSSEHSTEILTGIAGKLHDSESALKQFQDRILEIKIQLAKLQLTSFIFKQNEYKHDWEKGVKVELRLETTEWKPQMLTVEQRRVLRMLEISLGREVELEKKLTSVKQNEEDLKSKIRLMEQVAVCMEETAEVAWGRFLEADNRAEVLKAISKEMLGKLQIVDLSLTSSSKREEELKSKLQDCIKQLNEKETSIQRLNSTVEQLITDNAKVSSLRERVQMLEEKLSKSESQLVEANAFGERSRVELKVMEGEIESLRENVYVEETRAESAEEKVTHLTDTNVELTEELDFLKGSNESNSKKVSVLEKQLRELDSQLQHTRASSEAGQEQQNMLYSAIWDMETLIDELKQKVVKAESKTEITEEQCVVLSETNSDLNKELDFLRSRMELMESSLDQATLQKRLSAEDISLRTSLIMDAVMQLAMERERIQKQLTSFSKENKLLREKLQKEQNKAPTILQYNKSREDKEVLSSELDSADDDFAKTSSAKASEISSEILEVEESPMDSSLQENERESSSSASHSTNLVARLEAESFVETPKSRRMYVLMAILALFTPILAAYLFHENLSFLTLVESLFLPR